MSPFLSELLKFEIVGAGKLAACTWLACPLSLLKNCGDKYGRACNLRS